MRNFKIHILFILRKDHIYFLSLIDKDIEISLIFLESGNRYEYKKSISNFLIRIYIP